MIKLNKSIITSISAALMLFISIPKISAQSCPCTSSGTFPTTISGVGVTLGNSGSVTNYGSNWSSCGLSAGPMWVGQSGPFVQTYTFSTPVNNVGYVITASNTGENFTFGVSNGVLAATQCGGTCPFTQVGNTFNAGNGSGAGSGTIVFLNSSTSYTSITISGTGTGNGSLVGLCIQSFSACTTPTLVITPSSTVCAGSPKTLTVSGATSYSWIPSTGLSATTGSNVIATPSITTTYSVTAGSGTCTAMALVTVTVLPRPTPTITSNSPVCSTKTLNLSGSGGGTYSWTGPSLFSSALQNPSINNVATTNSGTYTLVVTGANSCTASVTSSVTINPTPTVTATGTAVCAGQNINLTSNLTAGATYFWSGPNTFTSSVQNPVIANAQASLAGAYNLTVTSSAACSNTAVANVTVVALPIPTITSNAPICANATLNLTGGGGTNYVWSGPNAFVSATQNPVINNVTTLASGIYTLLVTSGNCSATTTSSITINANPVVLASNTGSVCETKSISVSANGGGSYNWSGPGGFTSNQSSFTINSAATGNSGIYTVVVTNSNNCSASAQTTVVVNSNPTVISSGGTVCIGTTATLSASGGSNYSWIGPNGFTSNQQTALIVNTSNLSIGIYTVMVTAANTCTSFNTASIGVNQLPIASVNSNGPICLNSQLNLQGGGGTIYSWTGPNNFVSNVQNPSFIANSSAYNGIYVLTISDNIGCSNSVALPVVVNPLPLGTLVSSTTKNCVPFCSTFSVVATTGSSAIQSVNWIGSNGGTINGNSLSKCFTTAGDYNFTALFTDANGCSNTSSFVATAYPLPVADFNWSPETPLEKTELAYFTDLTTIGGPATKWNWWFINNDNISQQQNPTFMFPDAGVYPVVLVVKNQWGCADTILKTITIAEDYGFYIPNAFTPNGDDINDVFQPKAFGVKKFTMSIFDRWGERLFVTNDFYKGWDGTYKGLPCKNDVYVYKITLTNSFGKIVEKTGHVSLIK